MKQDTIGSTELEQLAPNHIDIQKLKIGSFCHYNRNKKHASLCIITAIQMNGTSTIVDLSSMKQKEATIKDLSIVTDTQLINTCKKLNGQYHRTHRKRNTFKTSYCLALLCLVFSVVAIVCIFKAHKGFQSANDQQSEAETRCLIVDYDLIDCEYQCGNHMCNGTAYEYYGIAESVCGNDTILDHIFYAHWCPEHLLDTNRTHICWVFDCEDGFYLIPPANQPTPESVVLVTIGYLLGICGFCCGLYALAEYISTLGTIAYTKNHRPRRFK